MSLVDRINYETRTIGGVPWQPWTNPYWKFNIGGPVHPSRETQGPETIFGLAAVYAAIRHIADQVASLPIRVYRSLPDGTSQRVYSSQLLGNNVSGGGPQVTGTLYDWIFSGCVASLGWGNAFGYITNRSGISGPDGLGIPTGIAWLPPERISVRDNEQQPENPLKAEVWYNGRLMDKQQLVHLKCFSIPGKYEALSPMRLFMNLWAQGLSSLQYSADWFRNGGFPPGTFRNVNEEVDEGQAKEIRRRLTDTIRLRQPLVFGRDWEYKEITVPPNEAAFIQAQQLNSTQVAAIYGVHPSRVGGMANQGLRYSNVTMDQLDELQSTLRPWLTRWEHLLTMLLPATQYAKFDTDALLKTDPHTRNQIYAIQRTMGTRTQNEIRSEDDMKPIDGGDDAIPQPVLERMVTTTRALPKSILPQVMLEVDHIVDLLKGLQEEGMTPGPVFDAEHPQQAEQTPFGGESKPAPSGQSPNGKTPAPSSPFTAAPGQQSAHEAPAVGVTPEQYLGRLVTSERAIKLLRGYQRSGKISPQEALIRIGMAKEAQSPEELAQIFSDLPHMEIEHSAPASGENWLRTLTDHEGWRASDEDRKHAVDLLNLHHRRGRINATEKDERIIKAREAVRLRDLGTLFTDLPPEERAKPVPRHEEARSEPSFVSGSAALAELYRQRPRLEAQEAAMNGKAH